MLGPRGLSAAWPGPVLRAVGLPVGPGADRFRPESGGCFCCCRWRRWRRACLAFGIGTLVFRRRGESGPYFSMITLALALLAGQVANNWESVTGGFNGLKGIPGLPGLDSFIATYYVAAAALVLACGVAGLAVPRTARRVVGARLAHNERRVVLFGFDTNRLKAVAFGVSGLLAGVGGALYAPQQGSGHAAAVRLRAVGRPRDLGRGGRARASARARARRAADRRADQRAARQLSLLGDHDRGASSSRSCWRIRKG